MDNSEKICLLCTKQMQSCIDICNMAGEELKYIDKLHYFITDLVLPEEHYPINICKSCSRSLKQCYDFKKQCINSIEIWKESIQAKKAKPKFNTNTSNKRRGKQNTIKSELKIKKEIPETKETKQQADLIDIKSLLKTENDDVKELSAPKIKKENETLSLLSQLNFSRIKSKLGTALKVGDNSDTGNTVDDNKSKTIRRRKIYVCKTCEEQFTSKYNLQRHMLLHRTSKCFICNICGKRFISKLKCKVHTSNHSPQELFCKLCHKSFKEKHTNTRTKLSMKNGNICEACRTKSS